MAQEERTNRIDAPALLRIAGTLERDGDSEGALQVYNDVLAGAPRSVDALVGKGQALITLGRFDQAVRFLERATKLEPDRHDVWSLLGMAALGAGKGDVALTAFSRTQRTTKDPAENYLNLARAAYYGLDMDKARDYIDLSLAENPSLAAALQWESALKDLADRAAFLIDVGRAHGRKGRFEMALSCFVESLKERESAEGHLYASRALVALSRHVSALEHLERARELDEANVEVLRDLADSLAINSRASEAVTAYDQLLTMLPDDVKALIGKVQVLLETGDTDSVSSLVERLAKLAPQNPETWFLHARLCAQEGDRDAARLAVERAIVRDTNSPLVWRAAAELMDTIDQPSIALLCRGRAEFAATGKNSSSTSKQSLDLPEFASEIAELDSASLTEERLVESMRNRATVYANLGQVERALEYLALVIERFPGHETEELARHRGSMQLRLGNPTGARQSFQRALALDPSSERARIAIKRLDDLAV